MIFRKYAGDRFSVKGDQKVELFKVQTLEEAAEGLQCEFPGRIPMTESVPLAKGLGRILGADVPGGDPVPHFARSVVDGYAVAARDTFGAGESAPGFLTLVGSVEMGKGAASSVSDGTAVYVPTGGALPAGADAVVMVEYAEPFGETLIAVSRSVAPGENVLGVGEDLPAGGVLLRKGQRLRPQDIGVLAAAGVDAVSVVQPLRVAVLSTGDEIVPLDELPGPGQIRDINTYTLAALVQEAGAVVSRQAVVKDDFEHLHQALTTALRYSDVVLLSGGSSVGVKDYTARVMEALPDYRLITHGLAVKPGKPTIIATIQGKPVFGLPGQPASAMVVFKALVEPFLRRASGETPVPAAGVMALAAVNIPSAPGRTTFQMVTLEAGERGLTATPVHGKSGMISLMSRAQGYIRIDARKEGVMKGEAVKVVLF